MSRREKLGSSIFVQLFCLSAIGAVKYLYGDNADLRAVLNWSLGWFAGYAACIFVMALVSKPDKEKREG